MGYSLAVALYQAISQKKLFLKSVCTTLTKPFLFADSVEMGRAFKKLYLKLCQMPFAFGQNDHQKAVVKFILDYANDDNPIDEDGETPLHTAAQNNDLLSVLLILHHYQDKTYLQLAARYAYMPYAKDKNPADKDGITPLHWAARLGYLETVKLLLEYAKDKNPADKDGQTPLHLAAERGHLEIVKLLLEHAKDKNPVDKYSRTPLYIARREGYNDIVKLIQDFNKDLFKS
jgi:ankyrin repeat protein